MELPNFLDIDAQAIKDSMKADYEQITGRTLYPGQVEQLLIDAFAYREYLLRINVNDAARMNLVSLSRAPFLDYLGQLVGVRRLTESAAACQVKLSLIPGHGNITIPAGIRFQTTDGNAVFALDNDAFVDSVTDVITTSATCLQTGKSANGYAPGFLAIILDPQPYLFSVGNIDTTAGGADAETDDELRTRILLAPQAFSNAGSRGAYEYFARSANPAIVDVSITSPNPGQVKIYPLLADGAIPSQPILDQVMDACNSERVRPLTDDVEVIAPTELNFNIEVNLTLLTGAVSEDVSALVEQKLTDYAKSRRQKCGLDVVLESIIKESMQDGVYSAYVVQPASTLTVNPEEVAKYNSITVNVVGFSNE